VLRPKHLGQLRVFEDAVLDGEHGGHLEVTQRRHGGRHVIGLHRHEEDIRHTEGLGVSDHRAGGDEVGHAGNSDPVLLHVARAVSAGYQHDVLTGTG
jgi:hypothetical protein